MNDMSLGVRPRTARGDAPPALARFLANCLKTYAGDASGAVADYIPELSKAHADVTCLELPLEQFAGFRARHPASGERIAHNLAAILSQRLVQANNKIELLTGY